MWKIQLKTEENVSTIPACRIYRGRWQTGMNLIIIDRKNL
jgi:hypothetical protein